MNPIAVKIKKEETEEIPEITEPISQPVLIDPSKIKREEDQYPEDFPVPFCPLQEPPVLTDIGHQVPLQRIDITIRQYRHQRQPTWRVRSTIIPNRYKYKVHRAKIQLPARHNPAPDV